MKILDRISILIFNLCLLFSTIIIPALTIAATPEYYYSQFEKNGIYGEVDENGIPFGNTVHYIGGKGYKSAIFTEDQLNSLADHTVEFLFGDKDSFALTLDGVYIRGEGFCDGVEIFGETAVLHMADVKTLMHTALIGSIVCAVVAVALLIIFIKRRYTIGKYALKYTLIFYAAIFAFAATFCITTYMSSGADYFLNDLWTNIHYLLFPFQPEKFENSFFNDTLTQILTLELFINAVIIVVSVTLTFLTLWFIGAILLGKQAKKHLN